MTLLEESSYVLVLLEINCSIVLKGYTADLISIDSSLLNFNPVITDDVMKIQKSYPNLIRKNVIVTQSYCKFFLTRSDY